MGTMIDEIDLKILQTLQANGRVSVLELAEAVGLSPTPCARRMKQMEAQGLIKGYTALVDPEHLGLNLDVFVNVRLRNAREKLNKEFENYIRKMPETLDCYLVTGEYEYLIHVRVQDISDFNEWLHRMLTHLPIVTMTHSIVCLKRVKCSAGEA